MTKRAGNLYNTMLTRRRMELVFSGVMKDKKFKRDPTSLAFMIMNNPEYYKAEAARILAERAFKPKRPRESIRFDAGSGKERHIQAPSLFPDQFIHWSVVLALQDVLMKGMYELCCASVKGRGTLYAKNFIEKKLNNTAEYRCNNDRPEVRYKYCLKMDIRKFFQNIDRDILMEKLQSKIKDKEMLYLCSQIIYSVPGTGLPLGYYTSQWFANFYLQEFDHYMCEVLMPKYGVDVYVRYMDDMVILGPNKRKLLQMMTEISEYLNIKLKVNLKDTSCVFAIAERDIDFVGFRFSYGKTILRKGLLHAARKANRRLYSGKFTIKNLRSVSAYNGWLKHSDTKIYREEYMEGDPYIERLKLKEFCKQDHLEYINSIEFAKYQNIRQNTLDLRKLTENGDGKVLIRYYPGTDSIKVVARCRYEFPDQVEYDEELRKLQEERNNKKRERRRKRKRRHKPGIPYYPTAEMYFGEDEKKGEYYKNYNYEINSYEKINEEARLE